MQSRRLLIFAAAGILVASGVMMRPYLGALARRVTARNAAGAPLDGSHYARQSSYYAALGRKLDIVMLGDSRVEWRAWTEMLGRGDISNRGIAGDTTAGILRRVRSSVPNNGGVVVIQAGVNDLNQGVKPDEVMANFRSILKCLREEKQARVIVTSIILVGQVRPDLNHTISDCNRELSQFTAARAEWLDLNAVLAPQGYLSSDYSEDGVHLNERGYEEVCRVLAPHLPAENAG